MVLVNEPFRESIFIYEGYTQDSLVAFGQFFSIDGAFKFLLNRLFSNYPSIVPTLSTKVLTNGNCILNNFINAKKIIEIPMNTTQGKSFFLGLAATGGFDVSAIYDVVYPVGSIYDTTDLDFDPNEVFGGTWVPYVSKQTDGDGITGNPIPLEEATLVYTVGTSYTGTSYNTLVPNITSKTSIALENGMFQAKLEYINNTSNAITIPAFTIIDKIFMPSIVNEFNNSNINFSEKIPCAHSLTSTIINLHFSINPTINNVVYGRNDGYFYVYNNVAITIPPKATGNLDGNDSFIRGFMMNRYNSTLFAPKNKSWIRTVLAATQS